MMAVIEFELDGNMEAIAPNSYRNDKTHCEIILNSSHSGHLVVNKSKYKSMTLSALSGCLCFANSITWTRVVWNLNRLIFAHPHPIWDRGKGKKNFKAEFEKKTHIVNTES